jgi:hypothetical protein
MIRCRVAFIAAALMLAALSPAAFGQDGLYAKIPQRVYFVPVQQNGGPTDAVLAAIPDYLYTTISARQPIVRVANPSNAGAVVTVSESTAKKGGVTVRLMENGREVDRSEFSGGDYAELSSFVERTAESFAKHLGFVEPKIVRASESTAGLIRRVQRADEYARPTELSLDVAGVLRFNPSRVAGSGALILDPFPVVFSLTRYRTRNFGFVGSLWSYYGNSFSFGQTETSRTAGLTRSLFILPGIGVMYRSLGDVYATFSARFYGGYGYVTNTTSERIGSDNTGSFIPFLDPGASKSIFFMLLHFSSDVGYNLTPRLALRTGLSFDIHPTVFFGEGILPYPLQGGEFFMHFLSLGVVYRF